MGTILKEFIDTCQHSKNYPAKAKERLTRDARQRVYFKLSMRHNHNTLVRHSLEIKNILDHYCK